MEEQEARKPVSLDAWLWQEIERRFGEAAAKDLKAAYVERRRQADAASRIQEKERQLRQLQIQLESETNERRRAYLAREIVKVVSYLEKHYE